MKRIVKTFALLVLTLLFTACSQDSIEGKGRGFTGEITVKVIGTEERIEDIVVVSHKETDFIMDRAFPILKERIIEAQSPIVDSVSGATYTSLGVKRAVNDALKKAEKDFGRITMKTKGPEEPVKYLEDVKTDIVIVGGGPAGLAAAISAKEAGAEDVILVEKMDILSGNGKYDRNFFGIVNSKVQNEEGYTATADTLYEDMLKSNKMDSPSRLKAWANGASLVDIWFRKMGITLDHRLGDTGHMHKADAYAGAHIQDGMEGRVAELGVDVRTGTKGLDLIMDDKKVVGVRVQNKNNFYNIMADAVVIATGGFVANQELLLEHNPEVEGFAHSNQTGATGDFLPVFERNNIQVDNLDVLSIFGFILTSTRDLTGEGPGYVLVNVEGERFIEEAGTSGVERGRAILNQTDGVAYYIYDNTLKDTSYRLTSQEAKGLHTRGETLEELAEKLGLNVDNFMETMTAYNRDSEAGSDSYGKIVRALDTEGPYYGVEVESAVHMTKGGVVANEKSEVFFENGSIVEGLYAAGEVVNTRAAYSGSVVFGRIAGESAAEYIKK
ncbi:flavocytochrome c [Propionigenium maris DSM 9537]|uniref:Flavocytochrome c n=1 Tax=Propionigenium maris DSM 9537 TaxID=1123000 RepID=A0A9W6LN54_9FUSO|nr:FAD-binding protein [Propionigenium maris]GLI56238.1 flavocytochrome c [Propionigenium maris DSM 9537]